MEDATRCFQQALQLAPDFAWACVDHLQEYGPERLDVVGDAVT